VSGIVSDVSDLVGLTFSHVEAGYREVRFVSTCGREFRLAHTQDCCESVTVEDIVGCLDDLVGVPILDASERVRRDKDTSAFSDEEKIFAVQRALDKEQTDLEIDSHGHSTDSQQLKGQL